MASIKNLKKDINYTLGDIIEECYVWELLNPKDDTSKSEAIINDAISMFDELLDKVHAKNVDNKKSHYRAISQELELKAKELIERVNNL